jgi:signal transduction histidine kinase
VTSGERSDLQRLLDAVLAISTEWSLPVVLRRIVEVAIELVDAQYGALGVLDPTGSHLTEFIYVGISPDLAERIGTRPEGHGILGLLITDPKPIRIDDLREHPNSYGFPDHHPQMSSFLGVPIRVRGNVFGNLYLTQKRAGARFTELDEELLVGLAGAAGAAIESVRLHHRVAELSVIEDRERIARDLHDSVIQRLFAIGLLLQGLGARIDDPEVAGRLERAVDDLDDTVRHIRTTIFELQRRRLPGRSVRQELLDLVAEAGEQLGTSPLVHFDGPIDSVVPAPIADHLLAVAREALTNVVKHARTPKVEVSLTARENGVTLTILDEGIGLPEGAGGGHGLPNLRSRAEELGGMCSIERRDPVGTEVVWSVPLRQDS